MCHWRRGRLLLTACVSTVLLAAIGAPSRAENPPDPRQSFVALDSEIQAIKAEILEINQEILLLEESALYPPKEQWVVLISVAHGSPVTPERITLRLDGHTVSDYAYNDREGAALREGGVHRLHAGALTAGEHRIDVSLSGKRARNKRFQQQRSLTITKLPGRKTMELQLGTGEGASDPGITIRQWQQ